MTSGMPEIGSKISLISRADIRYEGRLFTVDPQECTIALSNVRSFGTEERETQYPIAPQNQVYDYILFRGSDIKDIRVVPPNVPPMPNDPAIMQMQPQNQMGHQNFQPQFPVPVMGPQMGQFGPPYGPMGYLGGLGGSGMVGGAGSGNLSSAISKPKQTSVLDLIAGGGVGGSRSTTPVSLISRKSPTIDMAVQTNQPRSSSRDAKKNNNQQRGRDRHDSGKQDNRQDMGRSNNDNQKQSDRSNQNNNNQRYNQQNQGNQQNNRGWNRGGINMRGRPRGRGGINQYDQQSFRQPGTNQKRGQNKTIKFDSDYDFEQANNKFEELRSQLSKLKVGEEAKPEQVNGEADKKDDSGNETGAGDNEPEEEEISVGYDKAKSFFDNISCEASITRNRGKNRVDWRQERKLNSETFGISSTRRGGYRGGHRGGYFNRNTSGGYHRGGYRGNYRGRMNSMNNRTGQPTMNNITAGGGTSSSTTTTTSQQQTQKPASASPSVGTTAAPVQ